MSQPGLDTMDILEGVILSDGGCPVYYRMLVASLSSTHWMMVTPPIPAVTIKNTSRFA